ncbi:rRNA maturation RNase YbeY [soil metagenome]
MTVAVRVQPGSALAGRDAAGLAEFRRLLARAVRSALRHQKVPTAEVSLTLLDDAEIEAMNREFLQHAGPTDVISFPLFGAGEDPVADIYIGYDQVLRQAVSNDVAADEEMIRVAVHGVLHALGHDHPAGADRDESPMWAVQEEIVAQVLSR